MHGLGRRSASRSTATPRSWRTCSIRARGSTGSRTSRCVTSRSSSRRPTRSRARSTSTARPNGRETGRRRARCSLRLADALGRGARRARAGRALREHRAPARPRPRQDGSGGRPHRRRVPRRARQGARRRVPAPRSARSTRTRASSSTSTPRRSSARILFEKLGLVPVKKTKTGPSTDADSLQKLAAGAPDRRDAAALPRGREAARHLRRRAAAPRAAPTAASTRPSTSSRRPPAASRASRRTCRTCRCARPAGGSCARRSSPTKDAVCSPPTTRRSSCACSRTSPTTRASSRRSNAAPTSTPRPRRRCSTSTRTRSTSSSAASPRSSTTASRTAWRRTGSARGSTSPPTRPARSSTRTSPRFPNIAAYMTETIREAKSTGYTTTLFGRRRQLPELSSDNFRIRQMGERMAQNAPVQGTAADIFKLAMIDLDRALDAGGFAGRMVLTVHDELVLEVPLDERERVDRGRARDDGAGGRAARAPRGRHRLRAHLGRRQVTRCRRVATCRTPRARRWVRTEPCCRAIPGTASSRSRTRHRPRLRADSRCRSAPCRRSAG